MPETGFLDRMLDVAGATRRYQVFVPAGWHAGRRWPVILFLHGAGEGGADGLLQTEVGLGSAIRRHAGRFPVLAVFPQAPSGAAWRGRIAEAALRAVDAAIAEFRGDPARIYLTGLSMGGSGTLRMAAEHPHRFAALVPVCPGFDPPASAANPSGAGDPFLATARAIGATPTWIFHGARDDVISVGTTRRMVAALLRAGGNVRYTEYPDVGHGAWDAAYAEPMLVPWLLSYRRR
ncbi:MAG TPA: prolyl oligopeptidase family serine peptidase [Longimicrobiales bacterium]